MTLNSLVQKAIGRPCPCARCTQRSAYLSKPQRAILAEMAFSGNPLAYAGGPWVVGDRATTAVTKRALEDAGMLTRDPESEGPDYRASRTLTAAGREEGERELARKGKTPLGWVRFGNVALDRCGEQAQYASRYIDGRGGYPHIGAGLRFRGDPRDYHFVLIHADDVEEWVRRWKANKEQGR